MRFTEGQLIADRYRIEKQIGAGSGAEVYQVWDIQRSTYLALKLLRQELSRDHTFISKFQEEANALSRLQHPNIVRFYELIQKDGLTFFLMDFINGTTLRQEINQTKGPFNHNRILKILRPVCAALQYAHHQGIIHCDLKPENILIDQSGNILLSDFGIALLTGSSTATPGGIGTPAYMAPEQIQNRRITPQTDIYSLGIVLYELLTGIKPFSGQRASSALSIGDRIRWEHLNNYPILPNEINPTIPQNTSAVIIKCLQKDPNLRYSNVMDLLHAMETVKLDTEVKPRGNAVSDESTSHVIKKSHPAKLTVIRIIPLLGAVIISIIIIMFIIFRGNIFGHKNTTSNNANSLPQTYDYPASCIDILFDVQSNTHLYECVSKITVQTDGKLLLVLEWKLTSDTNNFGVLVNPDTDNHNMFLVDDLGNRLDHIATGADTNQSVELFNDQSKKGWFLFPSPDPLAKIFYFVDDDNGSRTPPINREWP